MKKCVVMLLVGIFFVSVTAIAADKPIIMRLAGVHPATYPNGIANTKFAELVEQKTNGRIKIENYYAGELGDQKSYIEQMQLGTLDFADVSASPLESFVPIFGVLSMPYLYKDRDHKWRILASEVGQDLLNELQSAGFYGIAFYESGSRNFYAKEPIKSLADLKGKKIRVMQAQVCIDSINVMGGNAVPMAFSEIYSALQQGVIDGAENNPSTVLSQSHYEQAPYFTNDAHVQIPDVLIASKKALDKLSPEDREAIFEAGRETWPVQRKAFDDNELKAIEDLKAKGVTFIDLDEETMQTFSDAVAPVFEKYGKKFGTYLERMKAID